MAAALAGWTRSCAALPAGSGGPCRGGPATSRAPRGCGAAGGARGAAGERVSRGCEARRPRQGL